MQTRRLTLLAGLVMMLTAASLSACSGSANLNGSGNMSARDMMNADVPISQAAGPDVVAPDTDTSEPTFFSGSNTTNPAELESVPPDQQMKVAPFDEPKRFHESSLQGAANLVSYYTYANYYAFVESSTQRLEKLYTSTCTKCLQMTDWIDNFVAKNAKVETGVPQTTILQITTEKGEGYFYFCVLAENREPPIIGKDEKGSMTGYDSASVGKSLYRIEYLNGTNQITGIFKPVTK